MRFRTGDIADRLGVNAQHAGVDRARLLETGIITAPRRGEVAFALPHLGEYLREHVAAEAFDEADPFQVPP